MILFPVPINLGFLYFYYGKKYSHNYYIFKTILVAYVKFPVCITFYECQVFSLSGWELTADLFFKVWTSVQKFVKSNLLYKSY